MPEQQHPITPPPELVRQWHDSWFEAKIKHIGSHEYVATQAARWGADAELEACCEWLSVPCPSYGRELRNARRPKPPSLAEEALKALHDQINTSFKISFEAQERADLILAALERLQELEKGNE